MLRAAWFPATVAIIVVLWVFTRFGPRLEDPAPVAMPAAVADDEARELYLTPRGIYREPDIAANGHTTAAAKYRGFRARHDVEPQPGDAICPITRTKASEACTWIIDGKTYRFCCPPCIDEFVRTAREQPDGIQAPEAYLQR